jgi:hypothetical protein
MHADEDITCTMVPWCTNGTRVRVRTMVHVYTTTLATMVPWYTCTMVMPHVYVPWYHGTHGTYHWYVPGTHVYCNMQYPGGPSGIAMLGVRQRGPPEHIRVAHATKCCATSMRCGGTSTPRNAGYPRSPWHATLTRWAPSTPGARDQVHPLMVGPPPHTTVGPTEDVLWQATACKQHPQLWAGTLANP